MSKYSNLKFFDSNSDELNLNYDSITQAWDGIVYLPEVSVGLYETLTIYILEEVRGELGETKYIKPITPTTSLLNDTILVSFEGGYDTSIESNGVNNDISLYSTTTEIIKVNGEQIPELYIKHEESQNKTRNPQSIVTGTDPSGIFDTVLSLVPNEPIQINVSLRSELETYHKRNLVIHEVDASGNITHVIATIRIYGETVAEDERLEALISNIGMSLSPSDHFVFEDANLRESSPDWNLINRKRRELLLEASNIKPFIGTYKALLNAIKYFGYENITLKEYYLNINEQAENFGKLKAVAVPNQEIKGFLAAKSTLSGGLLPNSNLKKTSRFSLVYRLNNATGEYDKWDIPKVKEALLFSPDEILIKLYGLKDRLQLSYIPMHAKIVDICGEGDYFAQFNINTWNNQQNIYSVNEGVDVGYKLFPERPLFLEDLRKVSPLFTGINQDFTELTGIYDIDAGAQAWWKLGEGDNHPKAIDHIGNNIGILKDMAAGVDTIFAVDHVAGSEILYVEDASTWSDTHNITYDGAVIKPANLISWSEVDNSTLITAVTTSGAYNTTAAGNLTLSGNLADWPHKGSILVDGETIDYSGIIGQNLTVTSCTTVNTGSPYNIPSGTAITQSTVLYHPNSWVTNSGTCYYTHAGGVAGFGGTTVPPVHSSGSVLDGPTGVLWVHVPNGTANNDAIARSTPIGIYPKNAALTVTDYTPEISFTTTLNNGGVLGFADTECTLTSVTGLRNAGIITISGGTTIRYSGITGLKLTGCVSSITSGFILDGSATVSQRGFWEIATLRSKTQTSIVRGAKVSNTAFSNDSPHQTKSTKSLSFDAKSDYVSVPFVNKNIRPENALTLNVWVKHDSWLPSNTTSYNPNNAIQHIISCHTAPGGFKIYYEGGRIYASVTVRDDSASGYTNKMVGTSYNVFNATINGNQSTSGQNANVPVGGVALNYLGDAANNDWFMLTCTFDGRYIKLYVNGELVDQPGTVVNGIMVGGPAISDLGSYGNEIYYDKDEPIDLHLGGQAKWNVNTTINNFLHWDGLIDDASIWNTPLSAARIKELYSGVEPSNTPSLTDNPIDDITLFYTNYTDTDLSTFSEFDIPVGCPIVLRANSLLDTFDDCNFTWEDGEDEGELTTSWNKWWHRNVYEIQWRLIGPTVNGVKYDRSFRGDTNSFYEIALTLPYIGKYDIELSLYDLYNVRSVKFEKEAIEVKSKEIETYAITQMHVPKRDWNEYVLYSWEDSATNWDTANENEENLEEFEASYYLTLDRANYANSDADWKKSTIVRYSDASQASGFNSTPGPYVWENLTSHNWNSGATMSWSTTYVGADINAAFSFDIADNQNVNLTLTWYEGISTTLSTDTYTASIQPTANTDLTNWDLIADELNNLKGNTIADYGLMATTVSINNGVVSDCPTQIASASASGDTILYAKNASNYLATGTNNITYTNAAPAVVNATCTAIVNYTVQNFMDSTDITANVTALTCAAYTKGAFGTVTISGAMTNWPNAGAVSVTGGGTLRYSSRTSTQLTVISDSGITMTKDSPNSTFVSAPSTGDTTIYVANAADWIQNSTNTITYQTNAPAPVTLSPTTITNHSTTDSSGIVTAVSVDGAYNTTAAGNITLTGNLTQWPTKGTLVVDGESIVYSAITGQVLTVTSCTTVNAGSPYNIPDTTACTNVTGIGWEVDLDIPFPAGATNNGNTIKGTVYGWVAATACVSVMGYYELTVGAIPAATLEADPLNGQSLGFASGGATLTLAGTLTNWPNTGSIVVDGYTIEYNDIAGQVLTIMSDNVLCSPVADTTFITSVKEKEYPQLSKYTYNAVKVDTNNDGILDTCDWMLATANGADKMHDYDTITIGAGTGVLLKHNKFEPCNPTYDNAKIIKQHEIHNILNHFTFSCDNSEVPGIKKQEWTLKNNSKNINDIYYNNRWLTYVFDETGDYTVGLKITDVNGNEIKTTKNILTIK